MGALLAALLGCDACARAPYGAYTGVSPAPGAITVFDRTPARIDTAKESKAGAPAFIVPGTTSRSQRLIGTLAMRANPESVVVLLYGDNRPGIRLMTTDWGLPAVLNVGSSDPRFMVWGLLNLPVLAIQALIPKFDGFQDIRSFLWSHRYTGGNEKEVVKALQRSQPADVVINTGDLVENGRRGGQWADFVRHHEALRTQIPFIAAVGNHERTWDATGRKNWDAVMGAPPEPEKYWYALDLPGNMGRFVFLDSNILADPKGHVPDSLEQQLSNEMLAWADSALSIPARYKFLVLHHPIVTSGHYFSDWQIDDSGPLELNRRARLITMCRRRGVTAVLAGHEHLFQRLYVRGRDGRGFWHITTGGGGSPLYRISQLDRKRALAQTLPDSSKVIGSSHEFSVYHYCKLVIPAVSQAGERHVYLDVYRVRSNGKESVLDRIDLSVPGEEAPPPPPRKS